MTSAEASFAFGEANSGLQVGQSFASISAEFHLPPERAETPPLPCSTVPVLRDPNYVSRETLLNEVDTRASVPKARVAVVGLGGTGKTQLAVEYADSVHTQSPDTWIIWISAHNAARVQQSVNDVADRLKIRGRKDPKKNSLELLNEWLGDKSKGKWLAVLDNFDDVDVSASSRTNPGGRRRLTDYFPVCDHGSVVITTRSKTVARQLVYEESVIVVEPMDAQHASVLLEKKLGPHGRHEYDRLASALDFIPLAMSQAASYIRERGRRSSVEHYLQKIEKNRWSRTELLRRSAQLPDCDWEASASVLTTWRISFEYISRERSSAANLLSLMSMCDRHAIPECLVRPVEPLDSLSKEDSSSDDSSVADEGFEDDIAMLLGFSFVSTTISKTDWTMHRLVQDATQSWMREQGLFDLVQELFICRLCIAFPSNRFQTWETNQSLLPHVHSIADQEPNTEEVLLKWEEIMYRAGICSCLRWDWRRAENVLVKSFRVCVKHLGKNNERTIERQIQYADVLSRQGRWHKAEKLQLELLRTNMDTLGAEHPRTLDSKEQLSHSYQRQGRYKEAEVMLVEVMNTKIAALGMEHIDSLRSMEDVATTLYKLQGRFEEAENLLCQITKVAEATLGAAHPQSISSAAGLAKMYELQGRQEEAERLMVDALQRTTAELGPNDLHTISRMINLAEIYLAQRKLEKAEELCSESVERSKATHGINHRITLMSTRHLAQTYEEQERYEEAEALFQEVVERTTTALGADDPDTLSSIECLAQVYWRQDRLEEAEALFKDVLERNVTKLGPEHPETLNTMGMLGSTYTLRGRFAEAEELYKDLLEKRVTKLGQEHVNTLITMAQLARTYAERKCFEEAEELYKDLLLRRRASLGHDHLDTLDTIQELAVVYMAREQFKEAEELLKELLKKSIVKPGADDSCTLDMMIKLGRTYAEQTRFEEAAALYKEGIERMTADTGPQYKIVLLDMCNLALKYGIQERWEEAVELQARVVEGYMKSLGPQHSDTLDMARLLSTLEGRAELRLEREKLLSENAELRSRSEKLLSDNAELRSESEKLLSDIAEAQLEREKLLSDTAELRSDIAEVRPDGAELLSSFEEMHTANRLKHSTSASQQVRATLRLSQDGRRWSC